MASLLDKQLELIKRIVKVYSSHQDFKFIHPFTAVFSGPTGSGKTFFVRRLIEMRETKIKPSPSRIVYFYNYPQEWFSEMKDVEFVQGFNVEKIDELTCSSEHWKSRNTLIVLDDLMDQAADSRLMSSLFYEGSSKNNLSVIFITQNMFLKSRFMRTISLNALYLACFRNPRESTLGKKIAAQSTPHESRAVDQIYVRATVQPYSYLIFDFKQQTHPHLKYLSNVLREGGKFTRVFLVKKPEK